MAKTEIVARLGEAAVMLPEMIAAALAANDRLKLRLSLLQEAAAHASEPDRPFQDFASERRASGLCDEALDRLVGGARALDGGEIEAPGAAALLEGLASDLETMLAPLKAAEAPDAEPLAARLAGIRSTLPKTTDDRLALADIAALTSARREGPDSAHLLIMDLHKALNRLAAETAVEDVSGAKVHHLEEHDRRRVAAFMAGLHRTAPLAFGHPGLGTTAAGFGGRLTIQNDIGETDAHVLVLHVDGLEGAVTYTDVHRRRARFFISLFEGRLDWSPLSEQASEGLGDDERFFLVTGRFRAADDAELDRLLEFLGSRIVFLIDWNKARKALQRFVDRDAAIALLAWAAQRDVGHRAFLELGGADLVLEAVRRGAAGRVPYGVRLDGALGEGETTAFLRRVLGQASEGLLAGRSVRLIRDEIQADLAQRFDTAESAVLAVVVRHLGLSRTLAAVVADALGPSRDPGASARGALADRSKRLEAKADRLTLEAREICARLNDSSTVRRLIDEVEDAMDALDECAFLVSLAGSENALHPSLEGLADMVVDQVGQLIRGAEAASCLPAGRRSDAADALQAIDTALEAERLADGAERACIGAIIASGGSDARPLMLGVDVARALETATDHVAHAALALRERVLEELSA